MVKLPALPCGYSNDQPAPSERDLHAYVDHQLPESDRRVLETWLAAHPDAAAQVHAWQQDAHVLRASLSGTLQLPANPDLDPALIRRRIRLQSRRHLATAAVLLIAVSLGGLGGWHAREATQPSMLPMADAMQAFRLFAQDGVLPADYRAQDSGTMQAWLDRYFNQAHRLPDLSPSGFKPVSGRLLNTEQGTAAMVLYEDPQGRRISFTFAHRVRTMASCPTAAARQTGCKRNTGPAPATTMRWSARRIWRPRMCCSSRRTQAPSVLVKSPRAS